MSIKRYIIGSVSKWRFHCSQTQTILVQRRCHVNQDIARSRSLLKTVPKPLPVSKLERVYTSIFIWSSDA